MFRRAVKVALCQLMCGDDKQKNIEAAERAVEKAVKQGAQLVVLPVSKQPHTALRSAAFTASAALPATV